MLAGYSSYAGTSLVGQYTTVPTGGDNTLDLTNLSGSSRSETHYSVDVPAGRTTLSVQMSGGTGDADLAIL
jgi:serine protease